MNKISIHNKATLLTLALSAFGLITSFFASVFFSTSIFGWYTVLGSQVAFWAAVSSMGFLGYFLGHIDDYRKQEKNLFYIPVVFSSLVAFVFSLFNGFNLASFAFSLFLLVSVLANSFVIYAQIVKMPLRVAFFQGVPTLLKCLAVVLFSLLLLTEHGTGQPTSGQLFSGIFVSLSVFFAVFLLFVSKQQFSATTSVRVVFDFLRDRNFYASWIGVVMAFSFATAIPSLVAHKASIEAAAYFGIYTLFWSVSSTLTISLVTNRYGYQLAHGFNQQAWQSILGILNESFKKTLLIALLVSLGVVVFSLLFSELIWSKFLGIKNYLLLCAIILIFKSLQSWAGMLLALPRFVMFRTIAQALCITGFIVLLYSLGDLSVFEIMFLLMIWEALLSGAFLIYCYIFVRHLKKNLLEIL